MPELGEIRKSRPHYDKFIWVACVDCGKERWVKLLRGNPANARCHSCACKRTTSNYGGSGNPKWKGGISFNMVAYRKERNLRPNVKERNCLNQHLRKALKLKIPSNFTLSDWEEIKRRYNGKCACCGLRESTIKLTIDHVIPLCKGGRHTKENIQPLCLICNLRKARTILKFEPQRKKQ